MLPTNSNFDDEEDDDASQGPNLLEHIEQVREIFKQIDPSGTRGLNYDEFKTVLTDILNIEFDDDDPDQLQGIIEDLDPQNTGYIQFAALHQQWTQQAAQDDDMSQQFGDILDNLQPEDDVYQEPMFGNANYEDNVIIQPSPRAGRTSILASMRNSMDLLTFGKDKPVFDKTTLNKFCDLFQDYKEKNPEEQEFFLDLKKDLAIDNYSITDKELIAFFSKVTDEHATVIYESEFNEIMISFDKNYVISKSSVGKSFGKDMIDMNILDQKIKTILGQIKNVPKYQDGAANELKSVIQACIDDQCWHAFSMNPDSFAPFFEDLFKSIEIITDRMDILSNRNNTNQSILTELKLNNSHLLMDKEKLMEEQDETRRNLEKLQNQVAMMLETQSNYDDVMMQRDNLQIREQRLEQDCAELRERLSKIEIEYATMLEYNEQLQEKIGEIAMERDEMRQVIMDGGNNDILNRDNIQLETEEEPTTPKRTKSMIEVDIEQMNMRVKEQDELPKKMEEKYLDIYENLISGTTKSIGPEQAEAMLAIRKELLRREKTIQYTIKKFTTLEEEYDQLQQENDELTDSIVLQIKYNKGINKQLEWYNLNYGEESGSGIGGSIYKKSQKDSEKKEKKEKSKYQSATKEFPKFKKIDLPKLPGENPFTPDKVQEWREKIGPKKFEVIDNPDLKVEDIPNQDNSNSSHHKKEPNNFFQVNMNNLLDDMNQLRDVQESVPQSLVTNDLEELEGNNLVNEFSQFGGQSFNMGGKTPIEMISPQRSRLPSRQISRQHSRTSSLSKIKMSFLAGKSKMEQSLQQSTKLSFEDLTDEQIQKFKTEIFKKRDQLQNQTIDFSKYQNIPSVKHTIETQTIVMKSDSETQTFFIPKEAETQTFISQIEQETQTIQPNVIDSDTQTNIETMKEVEVQTITQTFTESEVQTLTFTYNESETQTLTIIQQESETQTKIELKETQTQTKINVSEIETQTQIELNEIEIQTQIDVNEIDTQTIIKNFADMHSQTIKIKQQTRTIGTVVEMQNQDAEIQTEDEFNLSLNQIPFSFPSPKGNVSTRSSFASNQGQTINSTRQSQNGVLLGSPKKLPMSNATGTFNSQGKYVLPRKIRNATKGCQTEASGEETKIETNEIEIQTLLEVHEIDTQTLLEVSNINTQTFNDAKEVEIQTMQKQTNEFGVQIQQQMVEQDIQTIILQYQNNETQYDQENEDLGIETGIQTDAEPESIETGIQTIDEIKEVIEASIQTFQDVNEISIQTFQDVNEVTVQTDQKQYIQMSMQTDEKDFIEVNIQTDEKEITEVLVQTEDKKVNEAIIQTEEQSKEMADQKIQTEIAQSKQVHVQTLNHNEYMKNSSIQTNPVDVKEKVKTYHIQMQTVDQFIFRNSVKLQTETNGKSIEIQTNIDQEKMIKMEDRSNLFLIGPNENPFRHDNQDTIYHKVQFTEDNDELNVPIKTDLPAPLATAQNEHMEDMDFDINPFRSMIGEQDKDPRERASGFTEQMELDLSVPIQTKSPRQTSSSKKPFIKPSIIIDEQESFKEHFELVNENQEKKARLAKAGESLKKSLVFNSKLRATSKALEKLNENPAKKGNLKETMMPSFKIHSCDHLGLLTTSFNRLLNQKNINKIKEVMVKNKEVTELDQIPYMFSDYIEKFDAKLNPTKMILIMTQNYLYIFNPKDMSCKNIAPLKQIEQILMVKSNDSLLGIKMKDAKDLFIETVRRVEFVVYISTNAELTNTKAPKIIQGSKINLSMKKHSQTVNFRTKNNLNLQKNFISLSPIFGYLMTLDIAEMLKKEEKDKKSWSIVKRSKKASAQDYKWEEKFYVLGSLGLIIMDKPNSEKIEFYPQNQFKIDQVPEIRYLRKNCFEITPRTSQMEDPHKEKLVLQAPNSDLVKSWINNLKNHQKQVFDILQEQKKQFLAAK